ncbi:MAG: UPF0149 family protein [Spongiibacteraceae bacterium]|nr:UPF0149 family protein [Spongiibacteraceae bacterium]
MTDTPEAPDFAELNELLQQYGAMLSPAELHGLLSGTLAAGRRYSRPEWLRVIQEQDGLSSPPDERTGDALFRLYEYTQAALTTDAFDFEPLLADEDAPLTVRAATLGHWCHGFLSGFGLAGGRAADAEIEEALRDIAAVAQVVAEDESEASENDFFTVSEYIRLAVLNIAWLNQPGGGQTPVAKKGTPDPAAGKASTPAALFQRKKLH